MRRSWFLKDGSNKLSVDCKTHLFSFNTYSGVMKMYLAAERKPRGLEVAARMLRPGEEGLGRTENSPHVVIRADVNCDTISLDIDGAVYKLDYGFGRLGVKDLGIVLMFMRNKM